MVVQRSQAQMLSRVVVLKRSWACESPGNRRREGQQHRGALWGRPAGDRGLSSCTRGAGQTLQGPLSWSQSWPYGRCRVADGLGERGL